MFYCDICHQFFLAWTDSCGYYFFMLKKVSISFVLATVMVFSVPQVASASIVDRLIPGIGKLRDFGVSGNVTLTSLIGMLDRGVIPFTTEGSSDGFVGNSEYEIVDTWMSKDERRVVLRRDIKEKIVNKHLLSIKAAKYITQAAPDIVKQGTTHVYYLPINRVQCGRFITSCKIVENRLMKAVVNYRKFDKDGDRGMITAYCPWSRAAYGNDECPEWVRNSPQFQ